MPLNEFSLIEKYFVKQTNNPEIITGCGDDAAVIKTPPNQVLVTSVDTMVCGVHFFEWAPAHAIGYKALASNLSDLAAMGATPSWFTLAITLPVIDKAWLTGFSKGLFDCAGEYNIDCIGGDTTKGPLTITIQVGGYAKQENILHRNGAIPGDKIYLGNPIGGAAYALEKIKQTDNRADSKLLEYLYYPKPQLELGQALRGIASSAIDISDGLAADLNHILKTSGVGAVIEADKIPLGNSETKLEHALYGGDDYVLCFTIPGTVRNTVGPFDVYPIGEITEKPGILLIQNGTYKQLSPNGWKHF